MNARSKELQAWLREGFAAVPVAEGDTPDDATIEEIWEAVRGDLDGAKIGELTERVATDPAYAESWRVAMAFADSAAADEEETADAFEVLSGAGEPELDDEPEAAPANDPPYGRWIAVAVAVVAAVLLTVWLRQPAAPTSEDAPRTLRDGGVSAIESRTEPGPMSRQAVQLRWKAPADARHYDVFVTTEGLEPVLRETGLAAPSLRIEAAKLADLPPGAKVLWRVEAVMADRTRKRSETFVLQLD